MENDINNYLECLVSIDKSFINKKTFYKKLYASHIYKMSRYYVDEMGFISKPYYPLVFAVLTGITYILIYLLNNVLAISIVSGVTFFYLLSVYKKIKARKYY